MSFRVVLKSSERPLRGDPLYYLVAANGVFQVRDSEAFTSVTRVVGRVPGLLPQRESLRLRVPPLPASVLREALGFFRAVWEAHKSEAIVLLFYRAAERRYRVEPPPQLVAGSPSLAFGSLRGTRPSRSAARADPCQGPLRLTYGALRCPQGFVPFGTIHSHGDQPAAASALDLADEAEQDGLHVVFGDLHAAAPSRSACFVSNGVRFALDPADLLEACDVPEPQVPPAWWSRIRVAER